MLSPLGMNNFLSKLKKIFFLPSVLKCCDNMFWVSLLDFIGLGALCTCSIWVVLSLCSRKSFIISLIIFSLLFPPKSQEFFTMGTNQINLIILFPSSLHSFLPLSGRVYSLHYVPTLLCYISFWLQYFQFSNTFLIPISFRELSVLILWAQFSNIGGSSEVFFHFLQNSVSSRFLCSLI